MLFPSIFHSNLKHDSIHGRDAFHIPVVYVRAFLDLVIVSLGVSLLYFLVPFAFSCQTRESFVTDNSILEGAHSQFKPVCVLLCLP